MGRDCVRVPMVMQMEALECGAACLDMVLAYFGKWLPIERVRDDCGVSRDGTNLKNMFIAASAYGLVPSAYRCKAADLRGKHYPLLLHWNNNHFVLLCGFNRRGALLNDPARGTLTVSLEELEESFSGVYATFEKGESFVPSGKPKSVLRFAKSRLRGTFKPFLLVALTGLATVMIGVLRPVFSRVFIDRVLSGENPEWLGILLAIMLAVCAIEIINQAISAIYLLKIEGKFAICANATFFWHVLRLPMRFFSQRMAGDLAQRQQENESIASSLIKRLAPVVLNIAMLVFYLAIMLRYSLILTLIGVFSVAVNAFLARVIAAKNTNLMRVAMRDAGKLAGTTVSNLSMIETIKACGAEDGFFERWAGYQARVNASNVRFIRLNQSLGMLPELVSGIANVGVLMLGALLVMQGDMTVGMLMAFQGFLLSFLSPVNSLIDLGRDIQQMRTSMERIDDVMKYEPDVEADERDVPNDAGKLKGAIEMRNVTFGYSKLSPPLIEGFNLSVKPGGRVALVGGSGCGKSTIAKLISGLYPQWSGEILFDGKPRDAIPRSVFTGSLAVIDQEITLFEDSVSANIKLWDDSIEDYEMILAAVDARIHDDIIQRENGYGNAVREGGMNFSGGQRQRIEIARVLACDPTILILDEATSALDAQTEAEVIEAVKNRGITCVFIAHRLSTIRDCDEIIVLDKGKIAERGTHDKLMELNGQYARLVTSD